MPKIIMFRRLLLFVILVHFVFSAFGQEQNVDSQILHIDRTIIDGKPYSAVYLSNETFYIFNSDGDTIFRAGDYFWNFEFIDFNEDGRDDIIFHHFGNVPTQDLLLYNPKDAVFVPVKNFSEFPEPVRVEETKYYFSYHRSGCADMNWDSDLFYFMEYSVERVGNISGRGCDDVGQLKSIDIFKFRNDSVTLIESFAYDTIEFYKNHKWGFIEDYWKNNYLNFE